MGSPNTYDLADFRHFTSAFVKFKESVESFQEWLEADEGLEFAELLKNAKNDSIEVFQKRFEQSSFDREGAVKELKEMEFQNIRDLGTEIDVLLRDVSNPTSDVYKIRTLCVRVGGHLNELFEVHQKHDDLKVQKKLTLLHWIGTEHLGFDKLFDLFSNVLANLCELRQPDLEIDFENETKLALATRCIQTHAGKRGARIAANNRLLENQLQTLVWKQYVEGDAKWGGKRSTAIQHLVKFRQSKNKPIIQVIGEGGLGKTKLAIEFIKRCLREEDLRFDAVLMLTAKSEQQGEWNTSFLGFRNQETVRSPRDPTLAFGHYVQDMDYEIAMSYIYDLADVDKYNQDSLLRTLQREKYLIILDNFEDASEDVAESFHEFFMLFDELPECQSKIIITGRDKHEHASSFPILEMLRLTDEQALELMKKKYEFEYQRYYSDYQNLPENQRNIQVFDDFRKAINIELIPSIRKEIERTDPHIAKNFVDGVLHPGVLFYFISMLMDGTLYEDFVREKGTSPTFKHLFEYAICHHEYGIPEYIDRWDDWIKEKTTKYIRNDKCCLAILNLMAQQPEEFFDVISLTYHLKEYDKPSLEAAFSKLSSHDGVLENHLENGKKRISSSTIAEFKLKTPASLSNELISIIRPIYDDIEALARELPATIPDRKNAATIGLNDYALLVDCALKLFEHGELVRFEKCAEKLQWLFEGILDNVKPSDTWTIDRLSTFVNSQKIIKSESKFVNKQAWVREANSAFHSPEFIFSNLPAEARKAYVDLPKFLTNFLSLSQSITEFTGHLQNYRVPRIHGFVPDKGFCTKLERLVADHNASVRIESNSFLQLFILLRENFERLQTPTIQLLNQLSMVLTFENVEQTRKEIEDAGVFHDEVDQFMSVISELLDLPNVLCGLNVSTESVRMVDFFGGLNTIEVTYGIEDELEKALPFTELLFSQEFPSLVGVVDGRTELKFVANDEISENLNPSMRCFLKSANPMLQSYEFIQTLSVEKGNEIPNGKSVLLETTPLQPAADFFQIAVNHICELKGNQKYTLDIAQRLEKDGEPMPEFGWLEFLTSNLSTILDEVNRPQNDANNHWNVIYSLTGKNATGIERNRTSVASHLNPRTANHLREDSEVKNWFERKKKGMYADITLAKGVIDELLPRLIEFHDANYRQGQSPAEFATKFVQTFQRPYSQYMRTSMRWYAAFHAAGTTKSPNEGMVLDAYESELRRQLGYENLSNSKKGTIFKFCEDWCMQLRVRYNLPEESYIERKRRQDEARAQQRAKKQRIDEERRALEEAEWRRQREEKWRAEEAAREAEAAALKEQQRKAWVNETIDLYLQKPYNLARSTYIQEFHDALVVLGTRSTREKEELPTTMSKLISSCYAEQICHAKLSLVDSYKEMLVNLHNILEYEGFDGLSFQEENPRGWPLLKTLFLNLGFDESEMDPLRRALD